MMLSKYTLAVPTRDQRAETVAQDLLMEWFYKFGVIGRLHSDQGWNFKSLLICFIGFMVWISLTQHFSIWLEMSGVSIFIRPYRIYLHAASI